MHQSIHDGDHTGRVGEHLVPLTKGSVGGHNRWLEFIALIDDVEQQIRMATAVGELTDFIDHQHLRMGVVFQSAPQGVVTILCRQVPEHLGGVDEQRAVSLHDGVMHKVLCDGRFSDAVGSYQNDVGG